MSRVAGEQGGGSWACKCADTGDECSSGECVRMSSFVLLNNNLPGFILIIILCLLISAAAERQSVPGS